MTRLCIACCLALLLCVAHAAAADDCDGVMAALSAARADVYGDIAAIDALENAIAAPTWDPVGEAWMVDALNWTTEDLIADLNTAAIAEERAHAAHCY